MTLLIGSRIVYVLSIFILRRIIPDFMTLPALNTAYSLIIDRSLLGQVFAIVLIICYCVQIHI